ncbi:MAG: flagellar motor switch phosphatase FliY [Clostridium sp.]|nr:flagellar motor switch phosphatase FliY [Clostridium sp.]
MSNGFLSQDEINALLNGNVNSDNGNNEEVLSDLEKDLLGEVGNISMGAASTALYQLLNQKVNITTPVVSITTIKEIKENFDVPNIILDVEYVEGISGRNMFMMKISDAAIIANCMMGGDGKVENPELSELEISAVQEAMNQMIGSAATSMATMFGKRVDISPPKSTIWDSKEQVLSSSIEEQESIVRISFNLEVGEILRSNIMQVLPLDTAKEIVSMMMGEYKDVKETVATTEQVQVATPPPAPVPQAMTEPVYEMPNNQVYTSTPQVNVQKANFGQLGVENVKKSHENIDLILDVSLEISVVLGRTKKTIKDILSLGNGSLIELNRLADEPVEVLVNGKVIAKGEVVVVDENFGVRINNIVSGTDRIKSLR